MRFSKTTVEKYHGEVHRGEKREKRTLDKIVDQLAGLTRRNSKGRKKYEGDDGGRSGNKKEDLAWTAGQTAPADNLFSFLHFAATPASFPFPSLSFSLMSFSSLDYARLLYLISISLLFAVLSWVLSTEHQLEQFRRLRDIWEMRQIILQKEKHY